MFSINGHGPMRGLSVDRIRMLSVAVALLGASVPLQQAHATDTQQDDFVPLAPGTNVALAYYILQDFDRYEPINGPAVAQDTHVQAQVGIARLAHYTQIGGMPFLINALQTFGGYTDLKVGGTSLPRKKIDLGNLIIGAFLWPVSNAEKRQYLAIGGYAHIADGKWDARSAANLTDNRTSWNPQVAYVQGVSKTLDVQLVGDVKFYGRNKEATPQGGVLTQENTYSMQFWATHHHTPLAAFAVGLAKTWGGRSFIDGSATGNKTNSTQARISFAQFFAKPKFQLQIEASRDIQVNGGFRKDIGLLVRLAKPF